MIIQILSLGSPKFSFHIFLSLIMSSNVDGALGEDSPLPWLVLFL